VLFTWYLVWALPLAWALPRIARRGMVIMSAFFVVTQLVTESTRLPDFLRTVKLPFGHPIAIAVCVWIGADLVRRLRRGTPLDAENPEHVFGDRFESGPREERLATARARIAKVRVPAAAEVAQLVIPAPAGSGTAGAMTMLRL
jgi:hypothetical protein